MRLGLLLLVETALIFLNVPVAPARTTERVSKACVLQTRVSQITFANVRLDGVATTAKKTMMSADRFHACMGLCAQNQVHLDQMCPGERFHARVSQDLRTVAALMITSAGMMCCVLQQRMRDATWTSMNVTATRAKMEQAALTLGTRL